MRIKIFLKKLISISVAALMAVALFGCFDLGDFQDETSYYASFGEVRLVYQNPQAVEKDIQYSDYDVKDYFYNKNTGEDFTYGDPKDDQPDDGKDIPQLPYTYMAIPLEREMEIQSLVLYLNATSSTSMQILCYLVDDLPNDGSFTQIKCFGDPEYQQKLDGEGNPMFDGEGNPIYQEKVDGEGNPIYDENGNPVYQEIVYTDPDEQFLVADITTYLREGEWTSFIIDRWISGINLQVKNSQYLLLRFVNNGALNNGEKPSVAFRATNLLVRAFS